MPTTLEPVRGVMEGREGGIRTTPAEARLVHLKVIQARSRKFFGRFSRGRRLAALLTI